MITVIYFVYHESSLPAAVAPETKRAIGQMEMGDRQGSLNIGDFGDISKVIIILLCILDNFIAPLIVCMLGYTSLKFNVGLGLRTNLS